MSRTFAEFSEFSEFDKSLKHELVQFKVPVSRMCLAGAAVASWFVTQEVIGLNTAFCKFCRFCRFCGIHLGKTPLSILSTSLPMRRSHGHITFGHFCLILVWRMVTGITGYIGFVLMTLKFSCSQVSDSWLCFVIRTLCSLRFHYQSLAFVTTHLAKGAKVMHHGIGHMVTQGVNTSQPPLTPMDRTTPQTGTTP